MESNIRNKADSSEHISSSMQWLYARQPTRDSGLIYRIAGRDTSPLAGAPGRGSSISCNGESYDAAWVETGNGLYKAKANH